MSLVALAFEVANKFPVAIVEDGEDFEDGFAIGGKFGPFDEVGEIFHGRVKFMLHGRRG